MENASKALMMAASVLIAVLVISLGVYLYNIFAEYGAKNNEDLYEYRITEFNNQFTKYETMDVITIHDIISVINYAENYNKEIKDKENLTDAEMQELGITVEIGSVDMINLGMSLDEKNQHIEDVLRMNPITTYIVRDNGIEYNAHTGKVNRIIFIEN